MVDSDVIAFYDPRFPAGRVGTVTGWSQGRYNVKIDSVARVKRIKPGNVGMVEAGDDDESDDDDGGDDY